MTASALYFGTVLHRRLRPRVHKLRYRLFWMLFDLDELPELPKQSVLFSYNRFNILGFYDRDHADGSGAALRPQIERTLAEHNIALEGGTIRLFCMPRVFGYGFNPISVYFCHRGDGPLAAIIYEVHNTFGERHSYVFDARTHAPLATHGCLKYLHVSPFMDMDMRYEFRTLLPGERFALAIRGSDDGGTLIHASLAAVAKPFTTANLLLALLLYPLLTFKVTVSIHWHALLLWLKGIAVRPKPSPPTHPTTPVRAT
jgi:DUF1365 family protein